MPEIRDLMELASLGVEILAVVIMVFFITIGTARWVVQSTRKLGDASSVKNARVAYEGYRLVLGKAMLIGLELLVAADIIRTVALDATLKSLGILGGLVVVRTFLGWSITVEIEGHWPWQNKKE